MATGLSHFNDDGRLIPRVLDRHHCCWKGDRVCPATAAASPPPRPRPPAVLRGAPVRDRITRAIAVSRV
eukprot:3483924-Pyramimonas_sp.AAC.1